MPKYDRARAPGVAEMTGPYGPVAVAEAVIQRLWERGAFVGVAARLTNGKTLCLLTPGRPNRQEGPDFLEAEWLEEGARVTGDVEIHFYAADWKAHGHDRAPAFSRVRLHAVVFPPRAEEAPAVTASGYEPPVFVLLPHLPEDLESAALEDALMRAEGRPDALTEKLAALRAMERNALILTAARERWEAKVAFAARRIAADGPERALHGLVLETLGARRNRAPMAALAAAYPPEAFATLEPEALYSEQTGRWRLAGVRPANHPLTRLRAYAQLNREAPGWMAAVREAFAALPAYPVTADTAVFRRDSGYAAFSRRLRDTALAGVVGGAKFDTVAVDALLPWHAALGGRDHFPLWYHWAMGDAPDRLAEVMSALGLSGRSRPATNGVFQALLALALRP